MKKLVIKKLFLILGLGIPLSLVGYNFSLAAEIKGNCNPLYISEDTAHCRSYVTKETCVIDVLCHWQVCAAKSPDKIDECNSKLTADFCNGDSNCSWFDLQYSNPNPGPPPAPVSSCIAKIPLDQLICNTTANCNKNPKCEWKPTPKEAEKKPAGPGEDLSALAAQKLNPARFNAPADLIGRAIKLLLAFVGSITLVLYVYVGVLWMMAGGAPDRINKAKSIAVWTTLGVLVMLGSYILVNFVFKLIG